MINVRGKEMLFIEAHGHVWDKIHGRRFDTASNIPLSCGKTEIAGKVEQFLPPEFEDCRCSIEVFQGYEKMLGFDKAVLLQTPCYGEQYEYINEILRKYPGRYVSVGVPNPQDKKSYLETAELCLNRYGYKGLKFECPDIPFDMLDPKNAFVFETIQKYGAYCMIDLGWGDGPNDFPIDAMKEVVRRYPDLKFIFPHLGISRMWDPAELKNYDSLKKTLSMLEDNSNIWFDLSGIPIIVSRAGDEYPFPTMCKALEIVKQAGAADHLMWGSDYPTVLFGCTYQQHIDVVTKHCDFLSDEDMENIMGKTAQKVWFD